MLLDKTALHMLRGITRKMLISFRDVYHLISKRVCGVIDDTKIIIIIQTTKTLKLPNFFPVLNLLDLIRKVIYLYLRTMFATIKIFQNTKLKSEGTMATDFAAKYLFPVFKYNNV